MANKTARCIYCLKEKDTACFNREHVIPRMFGRYSENYVLNDHQVCSECNSYFSHELEVRLRFDSYEGLLRVQHGNHKVDDGKQIHGNRIRMFLGDGLYKGMPIIPVTDSSFPEGLHFEIAPCVGILKQDTPPEYEFYSLSDLPYATDDVLEQIRSKSQGIIHIGLNHDDAFPILKERGYLSDDSYYSESPFPTDLFADGFLSQISIKVDSTVKRLCAKTVFNYLCYTKGADYVLDTRFNSIRDYIRYGKWVPDLRFRISHGPLSTLENPPEYCHAIGYINGISNNKPALIGAVTWFAQFTYVFFLGYSNKNQGSIVIAEETSQACLDNSTCTITVDLSTTVLPKPL